MNACVTVISIVSNRGKSGRPRVSASSAPRGHRFERQLYGERRRARPPFHWLRGGGVRGRLVALWEGLERRAAYPPAASLRSVGGPKGRAASPLAAEWRGGGVGGVRKRRAGSLPAAGWRGGGMGGVRWTGPPSRRRPGGGAGEVCGAGLPFPPPDWRRGGSGPWGRAALSPAARSRGGWGPGGRAAFLPAAVRWVAGWVGYGKWQCMKCATTYSGLSEPARVLPSPSIKTPRWATCVDKICVSEPANRNAARRLGTTFTRRPKLSGHCTAKHSKGPGTSARIDS